MPPEAATPESIQTRTLRAFTILHHLRPDWGGALILSIGLGPDGAALSLAANMAGAVCLTLESDPTLLREAMRTASCDFIVNTLDEALRAIKNEVRQHKPLSVGLEGNPTALLDEILDRGLAPELFTAAATHPRAAEHFHKLGAVLIDLNNPALLEQAIAPNQWHLETFTFNTPAELHTFDTQAQVLFTAHDHQHALRRKWLQSAPRFFSRDRTRTLWLTQAEQEALQIKPTTDN